jgi:hypothetical protein
MADKIKQITVKKGSSTIKPCKSLWLSLPSKSRRTTRRQGGFCANKGGFFYLAYPTGRVMFRIDEFPFEWNDEKRSLSFVWKGDWTDERSGKDSYKEIPFTITFHRPIDYAKVKKLVP